MDKINIKSIFWLKKIFNIAFSDNNHLLSYKASSSEFQHDFHVLSHSHSQKHKLKIPKNQSGSKGNLSRKSWHNSTYQDRLKEQSAGVGSEWKGN